jgi:hypothetical protein
VEESAATNHQNLAGQIPIENTGLNASDLKGMYPPRNAVTSQCSQDMSAYDLCPDIHNVPDRHNTYHD